MSATGPADAPRSVRSHLHGFDGLRALAALTILVYHLFFVLTAFDVAGKAWVTRLNIGVSIFFVISGFLLYLPFARARTAGRPTPSLRDYAVRRISRIGPAYWVALPLVALVLGLSGVFTLEGLARYGLFLQIYDPATFTGGIGQAWTLDVEVVLYALLGFWVAFVAGAVARWAGVRGELVALGVLALLSVAWKVVMARLVEDGNADVTRIAWPPAWVDQFAVGMALAIAAARGVTLRAPTGIALTVAAFAGFGLLGAIDPDGGAVPRLLTDHLAKTAIAAALIAPVALAASPAFWSSGPARWIGVRSYGLYLWHLAVLIQLDRWDVQDRIGTVGFVLVGSAVSIGLGAASWSLIERPAIAAGRRAGKRIAARPGMSRADGVDLIGALVVLGAAPVLAFFSGGYYDTSRIAAAIVVWATVAFVALAGTRPWPRAAAGRVAIGTFAGLMAWTALSIDWAPVSEQAVDDAQRALLYLGVLILAAATLAGRARRAVLPAFAAGAALVIGYGLAGRLVPWLVDVTQTVSSAGRLEQPLTYWNAMGALAAMGLVACVALAGEPDRRTWLRAVALAAAPALALGVWLSFSRGGLLAGIVGLGAAALLAPGGAAARAALLSVVLAAPPCLLASALGGVRAAEGSTGHRSWQGAVVLAVLVGSAAVAVAARGWITEGDARPAPRIRARHPVTVAILASAVVFAALALVVGVERGPGVGTPKTGATADRLASTDSNRYAYWKVALDAAADHPLAGVGSGGFGVVWLRDRDLDEPVRDAHSLPIETLAELGLIGLLLLLGFGGAVGVGAVGARRATPLAAGPAALLIVYAVHACADWDWEMPAVTMPALAAAGFLLAISDRRTLR
ncbi:MAG: acyltransferase [Solirubrobacteraceae bacterium]|nr:acyltransferase [Solirubrobacteraceae bacterium]